jgi:hypothetical protein
VHVDEGLTPVPRIAHRAVVVVGEARGGREREPARLVVDADVAGDLVHVDVLVAVDGAAVVHVLDHQGLALIEGLGALAGLAGAGRVRVDVADGVVRARHDIQRVVLEHAAAVAGVDAHGRHIGPPPALDGRGLHGPRLQGAGAGRDGGARHHHRKAGDDLVGTDAGGRRFACPPYWEIALLVLGLFR